MKSEVTSRGFSFRVFQDANGVECSIQKSSAAEEDCIWLGARQIGLKKFTPYLGWEDVNVDATATNGIMHVANNRMHLNQEQVKELLPILQHFAETGELP